MPAQRHEALGRDVDVRIGLEEKTVSGRFILCSDYARIMQVRTSTVSRTLITPGCRRVRSFFRAFLARGRVDLFAAMSKEKMLQLLPSSCICETQVSRRRVTRQALD